MKKPCKQQTSHSCSLRPRHHRVRTRTQKSLGTGLPAGVAGAGEAVRLLGSAPQNRDNSLLALTPSCIAYWGSIGIMKNKRETTMLLCYIGITMAATTTITIITTTPLLYRDYYDCYYYHYYYYYNSTESTAQPDRVLATDILSDVRSSHKIHRSFNGVIVIIVIVVITVIIVIIVTPI